MKKVVKEERYDKAKKTLKRISLTALAAILTATIITSCNKKEQKPNFNYPFIEYNDATKIIVDDIILELAEKDKDGNVPKGFVTKGDICYRLVSRTGIAPEGYVLGTDATTLYEVDTEIKFEIPTDINTILVGSKEVTVVNNNGTFEYAINDAVPIKSRSK